MPSQLFSMPPPAPTVTPTPESQAFHKSRIKAQFKDDTVKAAMRMLSELDQAHKIHFNLVWNNPALTPQECFDVLGADASRIVQGSYLVTNFLVNQYALANTPYSAIGIPNGFSIAQNEDGTVTVSKS